MKNTFKKSTAFMLVLTIFISVFGTFSMSVSANPTADDDQTKYKQVSTVDGIAMVELEDYIIDTKYAKVEAEKNASGRERVKLVVTNTKQPEADAPGFIGFELTFDQPGKYAFYLRYTASMPDSIWMDWGAEAYRTRLKGYQNIPLSPRTTDDYEYLWKRVGLYTTAEAGETVKVRIRTREQNLYLDRLIITNVAAYFPEGKGQKPDPAMAYTPITLSGDVYPAPSITPPPEHPRVLFRASDIPQIKKNMEHPELATVVAEYEQLKNTEYSGELEPVDPNYDARGLEIIAAKALDYVLTGNEENGRKAISAIKNVMSTLSVATAGDNCRQEGHVLKVAGQVYDWCHPLLSAKEKGEMIVLVQGISADMEIGFPPDAQTILCGHGAEYQIYRDWLSVAIAAYDEYPDLYNFVGGKVFSPESVDYRNWWNQSGTHSQGTSYAPQTRWKAEMQAHILIKRMCGYELFNEEDLISIGYDFIYRRRPDGMQMIDGDDNSANSLKADTYAKGNLKEVMFLASAISNDPYFKREFFNEGGFKLDYGREAVQTVDKLILNNPDIDVNEGKKEKLPLTTYHASPVGEMIARTGWNFGIKSNDVVATMKIGEYNGMNHDNFDCGHFMIYYKGILANDSGWYEQHGSSQHKNYMSQSVAHNTLVIETPYNKWGNQNQGIDGPSKTNVDGSDGKNFYWIPNNWEQYQADEENHWAEVIGHEYGPDLQYPEYSYLAGDIANAYTSSYDDGVNEALRYMIFLPTGNEKNPAAFVVFDKIDTKVGGNKKAFLLHSQEEPEVNGNVTTIKRTERNYNGKLVNQTLLPKSDNLTIDKIGGAEFDINGKVITGTDKRFWNKGRNFPFLQDDPDIVLNSDTSARVVKDGMSLEAGWGRVEIMPTKSDNVDYMLNVMYVGEADDNSAVESATLIEAGNFVGAKIFDRVAMFNTQKERTGDVVSFTVSGSGDLKVNVAGLKAGTWSVSVDGVNMGNQVASEDGGMIYFTAPAGSYTLTYISEDANKTFTQSSVPETEGITIYYNSNYLYSDVPPTIRDGRTLIPMRALLEAMEAEVSWDEATKTATAYAQEDEITIRISENSKTAYVNDNPVELDVPAQIINGRFVIPVRFVSEKLGAKVLWDDKIQQVVIEKNSLVGQKALGIANLIKIVGAEQSGAEANEQRQINASYDGSHASYWGVSSPNGDIAWGIYDFGSVKTLDKVMFSFNASNVRKYKFDIEVSEDGKNFTPVIVGQETNGTTKTGTFEAFGLGGVKARYVKYKGYGNSVNMWNSMAEIVFTEKK